MLGVAVVTLPRCPHVPGTPDPVVLRIGSSLELQPSGLVASPSHAAPAPPLQGPRAGEKAELRELEPAVSRPRPPGLCLWDK